MAPSTTNQGVIVVSAFLLPIVTYLIYQRTTKSKSTTPLPPPTEITQLMIYPIKSCHGISVPSVRLLPTGLELDRQWMWTTSDFKFLTIRNLSKMTLIRPSYDAEADTLTVTAPAPDGSGKDLKFEIPAYPTQEWLASNTDIVEATVWSTETDAHAYQKELTEPFNAFFDQEVRLVYKSPYSKTPRPLVSNGAKEVLGRDASTMWADLMPVLVGSEKSIDELNSRLKEAENLEIPITRFRPNIIVRGHEPWAEDSWKTLRIAPKSASWLQKLGFEGLTLDVTQRCARCQVPNVDTETGEKNQKQPWDLLMKYRRIDEGITYKPCFGMLCVPRGSGGKVEVGMNLEVTEVTDKHRYMPGF